jgi:hypothetical protein
MTMGPLRPPRSLVVWIVAGVVTGAVAAVLAAEVLERARDLSLPAVYVVTGFAIVMIGMCAAQYPVPGWTHDDQGKARYHLLREQDVFFGVVILLTLLAVLGYAAAHLADWLLGRPGPMAYGLLGAGLGALASVPVRRACLWWLGPAPTDEEPEA